MADEQDINELVDKDLKGTITQIEAALLETHVDVWRTNLLKMKKRTEMQFTSSKSRSFDIHRDYCEHIITHEQFVDRVSTEKRWRVNAARFLQQVEAKLQEIKNV